MLKNTLAALGALKMETASKAALKKAMGDQRMTRDAEILKARLENAQWQCKLAWLMANSSPAQRKILESKSETQRKYATYYTPGSKDTQQKRSNIYTYE